MTDDEIVQKLRSDPNSESPLDKIELLKTLGRDKLTQFDFIRHFKNAFPQIPLSVVMRISVTRRFVGQEGISDDEVIENLKPWLPLKLEY